MDSPQREEPSDRGTPSKGLQHALSDSRYHRGEEYGPQHRPQEPAGRSELSAISISRPVNVDVLATVPKPSKYTGTSDSFVPLRTWELDVRLYLRMRNINPDSCLAFVYIADLTGGKAHDYIMRKVSPIVGQQFDQVSDGLNESPFTLAQICQTLRERFVSPTYLKEAQVELSELRQEGSDGSYFSIQDLVSRVEELADIIGETSQRRLKKAFVEAVTLGIVRELTRYVAIDDPEVTLDHLVAHAQRIEESINARERQSHDKSLSNYSALTAKRSHPGRQNPRHRHDRGIEPSNNHNQRSNRTGTARAQAASGR